jgi:hypothetical protein
VSGETLRLGSKKHESTSIKILKTLAAIVASGSMLAACSSGKSSKATNNRAPAHSANPTPNTNPASSSNQTNNSVGAPIANLCSVPAVNDYAYQMLGPNTTSCIDSFSDGDPFSVAIGNWSLGNTPSLFVEVKPNDQTQSAPLYPANSNIWDYDLSLSNTNIGYRITPDAVNNLTGIWVDNISNSYHKLIVKFGQYIITAEGGTVNSTESQFEKLVGLVVEYGFGN